MEDKAIVNFILFTFSTGFSAGLLCFLIPLLFVNFTIVGLIITGCVVVVSYICPVKANKYFKIIKNKER